MHRSKEVLTTGEVAKICKVAPRTVSKWFDTGKLRGYRIPGSKDRRIPVQQLVKFMRLHGIPLNGLDSGMIRVLIAEQSHEVAELLAKALTRDGGYEVRVVHSTFEAGAAAQAEPPQVMLVDVAMPGLAGRDAVRAMRNHPELGACKLIALSSTPRAGEEAALLQDGFDGVLSRPFDVSQVVRTIEESLGAVQTA